MANDKTFNPEDLKQILQNQYGKGVQVEVFPQTETEDPEQALDQKRNEALEFKFKPSEIKAFLDRYVIQQDDAKKVLATAVCDHYHHIQRCTGPDECRDYKKQNIILMGPTGVGKTYLIQNIARLIGVPFVKADATKFSETGYVGGDVEDLVRELVHQADGDIQLAEYGIIYLDEIDKIASSTDSAGRDVSGHGVQRGLLKLMEDTEVPLRSPTDIAGQMQALIEFQSKGQADKKTISTKHILFIVSGAFGGLLDIIKKRLGSKQIGFQGGSPIEEEHRIFEQVMSVDFIRYGFEAEFTGRLPVIVHCNHLTVEDLFKILKYSEGSLLKQYKSDFLAYDIDAYFTDEGMQAIAEKAETERTGARGLMSVCEKVFREYKYQLPDHVEVSEFVVEREMIEQSEEKLEELIKDPTLYRERVIVFQIGRYEAEFEKEFKVPVKLTAEAVTRLGELARESDSDRLSLLIDRFRKHQHALNLLRNADPKSPYELGIDVLSDPSKGLEQWIRETYQRNS